MAMSGGYDDGEPMMDMNMTPLIDVLLVLLIMFIITIPIQTHAVKVDLPVNDPNAVTAAGRSREEQGRRSTPAGTVTWNGAPVDEVTLRQYLDTSAGDEPGAGTAFPARSRRRVTRWSIGRWR